MDTNYSTLSFSILEKVKLDSNHSDDYTQVQTFPSLRDKVDFFKKHFIVLSKIVQGTPSIATFLG